MPLNRRWVLARRPLGALTVDDFALEQAPAPAELAPGQVLLKHRLFACTATARTLLTGPRASVTPGATMVGPIGAEVIASKHPRFQPGARLTTWGTWEDMSVLKPDDEDAPMIFEVAPGDSFEDALGLLGLNSCTAYFGLLRVAQAKAGETVVVSSAAGSIGSTVVQVAKIAGCRVIGIAGGREKCDLLVQQLGADAAIDYKREAVRDRLQTLCPEGAQVYFDNVGGPMLDDVMAVLADGGRVALCGQTSTYDTDTPGPARLDLMAMIYRSLTVRGFNMGEFMSEADAARHDLSRWRAEGRLKPLVDVRVGFEKLAPAFVGLFSGRSLGTLLVQN